MQKKTRLECNREIVNNLQRLVEKFPQWRFHQILMNFNIEVPSEDRWYEESDETLMKFDKELKVNENG